MVQSPLKNLDILQARNTETISEQLDRVAISFIENNGVTDEIDDISWDLADVLSDTQAMGDMLGRRRTFLEMDAMNSSPVERRRQRSGLSIGRAQTPITQHVPVHEAIAELVRSEPRRSSGSNEVRLAYTQERGFTLARANSIEVVKRVRQDIISSLQGGLGRPEAIDLIAQATNSNKSYAEVVYRTNVNTAFSAGRMRQASDPVVQALIGGFRFMATDDPDVRHNHLAANGLTAGQEDPIWRILTPPLGFNCRCTIRMVGWDELEEAGLVLPDGTVRAAALPPGAFPDSGFRPTRPDRVAYAGVPRVPIIL